MESVRTYPNILPVGAVGPPVDRFREARQSVADVRATYLNALAIIINVLSAAGFMLAAAFTSQFVLMTTFWQGVALGAITYCFFIVAGGLCGDV
jgi:hypothetical protein